MKKIIIGSDHAGFALKEALNPFLESLGYGVEDYGPKKFDPEDDYPDYVFPLAIAVSNKSIDRGIAICGSGVGASIAANKINNVRSSLIHDLSSARQGVEDDDMNIICLGTNMMTFRLAQELIQTFLKANFSEEPRHIRRLAKISKVENRQVF